MAAVALQAIIKPGQDVFAVNACYNKSEQLVLPSCSGFFTEIRDSESPEADVPLVISCYVIKSTSPYADSIDANSKRIKRPGLRRRKRKLN